MPIKKTYLKTKPVCKVTFRLKNRWEGEETPMKALKSGDFTATVVLPKGREYQYRYVLDDTTWVTDESADKQVFCSFANDCNAVVIV